MPVANQVPGNESQHLIREPWADNVTGNTETAPRSPLKRIVSLPRSDQTRAPLRRA